MVADGPPPRLCVLTKERPGQEYGYNLHAEKGKGQFVGAVDPGSIAERSGLRMGDRILAVNGSPIIDWNHKKVVERIKEDPLQCALLVLDPASTEWYAQRGLPLPASIPEEALLRAQPANSSPPPVSWYAPQSKASSHHTPKMKPRARLCELRKSSPSEEFGFNLHAEKNKGHFIGTVDKDGIGDKAGLKMGQRIVGVNGKLIYPTTPHSEVVELIRRSPLHTQLLVASEEVDSWYKENGAEFSFDYVETVHDSRSKASSVHEHLTPHEEETIVRRMTQEVIDSVYIPPPVPEEPVPVEVDLAPVAHQDEVIEKVPLPALEPENLGDDILAAVFEDIPATTTITTTEVLTIAAEINDPVADMPLPVVSSHPAASINSSNYSDAPALNGHYSPYGHQNGGAGLGHGAVPSNDIYALNAKEARERLRANKRNFRGAADMSLEEKYRLITNM